MINSDSLSRFSVVNNITVINKNEYNSILKHLHDCYMDYHTQAYQIIQMEEYAWEVLPIKAQITVTIAYVVRLSDVYNYIVKNWFWVNT